MIYSLVREAGYGEIGLKTINLTVVTTRDERIVILAIYSP